MLGHRRYSPGNKELDLPGGGDHDPLVRSLDRSQWPASLEICLDPHQGIATVFLLYENGDVTVGLLP